MQRAKVTAAQRKAAERQRYVAAGLRRLSDIWAHPEDHESIKGHAAKLALKRARKETK